MLFWNWMTASVDGAPRRPFVNPSDAARTLWMQPLENPYQMLHIGADWDAWDYTRLVSFRIGYIVACTSDRSFALCGKLDEDGFPVFSYLHLPLADSNDSVLSDYFPQFLIFFEQASKDREGKNILVHCRLGANRSVALLGAYLMYKGRFSASQALGILRRARPVPDFVISRPAFCTQLEAYEVQLREASASTNHRWLFYAETEENRTGAPGDEGETGAPWTLQDGGKGGDTQTGGGVASERSNGASGNR